MTDEPTAGLAEPCRDCRAPLVPGQRYCLYCGARRPDARMEFMDVLVQDFARPGATAPVVAAAAPPPPVRDPGVNGWLRQHTPVLALTGLMLGTLLIGLLIGHWATSGGDASEPAKAAAPQVIRVDAGSGGAATTPAADTATAADDSAKASGDKRNSSAKGKDDGDSAAEKASAPPDAVSADSLGSGEAKEKAIEKAAKKGQPISTGDGKLPPTDDKAPASGTEFETIG